MDSGPPQETPHLSIRRVLPNEIDEGITERRMRMCKLCRVKHNQIRDFVKVIVISIDEQNEEYCDLCLAEVLEKEMVEAKRLEEKYIYQKEFETSMSENERKILLSKERDPNNEEMAREVEQLEAEEKELNRLLINFKEESAELQSKIYNLEQKEEKFWTDLNKFEKRAIKLEEKSFIAKNQREVEKTALEKLSKESVVQSFFQIKIQDSYAQVCGLTLGKKPDQVQINWEETNSALAHILLAYNYLSLKYAIPYTRMQCIKIKGHLSEIQLRSSETYYPLAYSGKESEKVFGIIMEALLGELAELTQHIQEIENIEYTEELKLPFVILKKEGKIVDLSINPSKIQEKHKWTHWTKAMRYFLIDLKHILTVSLLSDSAL